MYLESRQLYDDPVCVLQILFPGSAIRHHFRSIVDRLRQIGLPRGRLVCAARVPRIHVFVVTVA